MLTTTNISKLKKEISKAKKNNLTIGFVPTMGYFHKGHLSLMRAAKKKCNFVVVSIFVNPLQFAPTEDLKKYPRDIKRDCLLAKKEGVDLVFIPQVKEMYPEGFATTVSINSTLTKTMCAVSRPTHFTGVVTVVAKLFNLVTPDFAFFGEKDYQQLLIIKKLVVDLNFPLKIISCPLIRDKDGLALSSRNKYLSPAERTKALSLYKSLLAAKEAILKGESNPEKIKKIMQEVLKPNTKIDYIKIGNPETLEDLKIIKKKVLIAVAAKVGTTRLIDNIVVKLS